MFSLPVARLLHILVFVYWLGGDLGAFYASFLLTNARLPAAARTAAGQVLSHVDIAPNIALILAAPTGLTLAVLKGWVAMPWAVIAPVWVIGLAWTGVIFLMHGDGRPRPALGRIDFGLRLVLVAGLCVLAVAGLLGDLRMPVFIALKLLILAAATVLGLMVRRLLAPFGAAYLALSQGTADRETDAVIASAIGRSRIAVMGIWALILCAAGLGLMTPT